MMPSLPFCDHDQNTVSVIMRASSWQPLTGHIDASQVRHLARSHGSWLGGRWSPSAAWPALWPPS